MSACHSVRTFLLGSASVRPAQYTSFLIFFFLLSCFSNLSLGLGLGTGGVNEALCSGKSPERGWLQCTFDPYSVRNDDVDLDLWLIMIDCLHNCVSICYAFFRQRML